MTSKIELKLESVNFIENWFQHEHEWPIWWCMVIYTIDARFFNRKSKIWRHSLINTRPYQRILNYFRNSKPRWISTHKLQMNGSFQSKCFFFYVHQKSKMATAAEHFSFVNLWKSSHEPMMVFCAVYACFFLLSQSWIQDSHSVEIYNLT